MVQVLGFRVSGFREVPGVRLQHFRCHVSPSGS